MSKDDLAMSLSIPISYVIMTLVSWFDSKLLALSCGAIATALWILNAKTPFDLMLSAGLCAFIWLTIFKALDGEQKEAKQTGPALVIFFCCLVYLMFGVFVFRLMSGVVNTGALGGLFYLVAINAAGNDDDGGHKVKRFNPKPVAV